jgi:hypothetical protein
VNGPAHFREAERLLALAETRYGASEEIQAHEPARAQHLLDLAAGSLEVARVHAELAETAATIDAAPVGLDRGNAEAWQRVLS